MEKLHKLLRHQLDALGINNDHECCTPEQWKMFIEKVNKAYHENDKYCYLLERSSDLSQKELESLHKEIEERREKMQAIMSDGLCFLDENYQIESLNNKAKETLKLESCKGKRLFDLVEIYVNSAQDIQLVPQALEDKLIQGQPYYVAEAEIKDAIGGVFQAMIAFNPIIKNNTFVGVVLVFRDLSEEKKVERLATFDSLTGLLNRHIFQEQLQHAVALAKRHNSQVALLFIDLDKFKQVNDNYRHEVGDLVLKEVAKRLKASIRESDAIARIGGDEFAVLLESDEVCDSLKEVAEKIVKTLSESYLIQDHRINIGCCVGIACYPKQGDNADQLLRYSDAAMYHCKHAGGNCYAMFEANMLLK